MLFQGNSRDKGCDITVQIGVVPNLYVQMISNADQQLLLPIARSSERLELLELEPGVSNVEVKAESQREPLPGSSGQRSRDCLGSVALSFLVAANRVVP